MRLEKYITDEYLIDKILKNSKPWFDYCKKQKVKNKFLWRGSNHTVKNAKRYIVRSNRTPIDTCAEIHYMADEIFKKLFGIKARSEVLFCFPNKKWQKLMEMFQI